MSNLSFCIEQRNKELQQTKKILALGLAGSVAVHAAISLAVVGLYKKPTLAEDPIELIMVDESSVAPEVPKPPVENLKQAITPPKPEALGKTEVSNPGSGGGQGQQQAQARSSEPRPGRVAPPSSVPQSIQPKAPVTPTQQGAPPSATSEQPQSVLNDPYESRSTVAANSDSFANQGASGSRPSSLSGNSQGTSPFGTGLGGTSSGSGGGSGGGNGSGSGSGNGDGTNPGSGSTAVATRSAPPQPPKPQEKKQKEGLRCVSECEPAYPPVLNGVEGSATVQIVVDASGNVVSATLSKVNNNSQINQQALQAARKMKFTAPPNGERASVPVTIQFTVAGTEFDRRARELREQQQRERQAREQERKARQAQSEQERQERQRQLEAQRQERERQAQQRQQQLQQQQQQQPKPQPSEIPPSIEPSQSSPTPESSGNNN